MKPFIQLIMIFAIVAMAACSKEKEAETVPSDQVLKPQIETLHKAEDLQQQSIDNIAAQRKQVEEQTQ